MTAVSGARASSTCVWIEVSSLLVALVAGEISGLRKLSNHGVWNVVTWEEHAWAFLTFR